ncbi:hypothetical protein [Rhodoligotrophos defluvii]|uniref:hypothetical protein n=1 Tax=Rhodoligotrophos defluvii TaxID=2561934 RepID=UPI0010C95A4E|nr:hypothetical protein [Rhodoligotrophos defluvii]
MTRLVLLLSLPILALGVASGAPGAWAQTRASEALDAYGAIVEARNAAETCGFLTTEELDELKHYSALGELAATKASSVAEMQAARDRALSTRPRCNSSEAQSVRNVLEEVRVAASKPGTGRATASAQPTPRQRQSQAQPEPQPQPGPMMRQGFAAPPVAAPAALPPPDSRMIPPVNMRDPVARYGGQARAYFLERKCNFLDYDSELTFWKLLTARYKVMVTQHGRRRVNAAQLAGEAEANDILCGRDARAAVLNGYRDIVAISGQ